VTHLRRKMLEELERRNYSEGTARRYLRFVEQFAQHFGKSPDKLGPDHLRIYQAYLLKVRKLEPGTVENHVAALRFLFIRTLHRYEFRQFLPYPKTRRKLPKILSREEVACLIDASSSLFERTLLMVLYGTGMRRAEIARLKIADIDSQRMIIHVVNGKGGKDRDLPLARRCWRLCVPTGGGSSRIPICSPHACIATANSRSPIRSCGVSAPKRQNGRVSARGLPRTWFDTAGRLICLKPEPTCAPFSFCSGTRIWRSRPGICISPSITCNRSPTRLKN
jgi:integrase